MILQKLHETIYPQIYHHCLLFHYPLFMPVARFDFITSSSSQDDQAIKVRGILTVIKHGTNSSDVFLNKVEKLSSLLYFFLKILVNN